MSRPPGLLVVAPSAYPLGGLATWLDGLLPGLAGLGWSVRLALPRGRTFDVQAYLHRHPWTPAVLLENPAGTAYGRRGAVSRLLREAPEGIVLVVNQPEVYAAALTERAAGRDVPRIVGSLHGLLPRLVEDFRRFAPAMTAAVGTNRLACEVLAELAGIERARIFHAPYGTEIRDPPGFDLLQNRGPLELVCAGRLDEEQKRVSDLPRILAALDSLGVAWRLSIAGSGPAEASLRAALGADRRVAFLGELAPERLRAELFRPGRALLLTSAWETGPIVAWEAMERGVVLVTSGYLGLRAEGALRDGENCRIFEVGDAQSAAAVLADLSTSAGERKSLALQGRRLVEERFSAAASIALWDRALRTAAALDLPASGGSAVPPIPAAGRLDRWLGVAGADRARRLLRRPVAVRGPGDEWPHTFSAPGAGADFEARLRNLERSLADPGEAAE